MVKYFEILVWPGGGLIGTILWMLSIGTVSIIVEHFISIRRDSIVPDLILERIRELFGARRYNELIGLTDEDPSFLSYVIHAGLLEANHGYPTMERAMEEAAEERTAKLLRHIEWLNLIGNISPMMGLLGTVWGMIGAFYKIVEVGDMANPAQLAESIGIALVTTLLGLAIAIPALAVYSIMRNRIDSLTSEAMVLSQELISGYQRGDGKEDSSKKS